MARRRARHVIAKALRCRSACTSRPCPGGAGPAAGSSGASRLGTKQRLLARVLAHARRAVAHAEARVLPAAHRQLEREVVDAASLTETAPLRSGVRSPRRGPTSLVQTDAARPYRRVVGQPDRLLGVGDLHDRERRAEGLLGHRSHRVVDVGEHGRLVEAATARRAAAAGVTRAPASRASLTWSLTMSSCGGKVIAPTSTLPAPPARPGAAPSTFAVTLSTELVVDRRLDVDALDRDARLAAVLHRVVDAALAARSRSASASTIIGSLPPSSSETGVSVSAARAITFLPVARGAR